MQVDLSAGPLSCLLSFARVVLKAMHVHRGNIFDVFAWLSTEARGRLENLPVVGPDLFNGEFLDRLVEDVKRHEATAAVSFKSPAALTTVNPHPIPLLWLP